MSLHRLPSLFVAIAWLLGIGFTSAAHGQSSRLRIPKNVEFHGHQSAVELNAGPAKVYLAPGSGGRVLQFTFGNRKALYLDDADGHPEPGKPAMMSAGRFDYGPELVVMPHPTIWSGVWESESTGPRSVRLMSPKDDQAGVQLRRDFELAEDGTPRLRCTQTIINIGDKPQELCHWGRSFSPGGGIVLIPLGDRPSRFPAKYAMYEDSAIINVRNVDDRIRERDGFIEVLGPPRKPKLGFDTYAGWLAYLLPDDTLFVKRFPTYPDRVYNEAAGLTLSVWYPGPKIELEPIGPRERLAPGERATFTEDWWLLEFPFPKAGESVDLKQLRKIVEEQTTAPPN